MTDQIKQDVMNQARAENWAAPRANPDWVPRFRFSGDIRTRYEGDFYPNTNDATGAFPNFNAINTGAPFDVGRHRVLAAIQRQPGSSALPHPRPHRR